MIQKANSVPTPAEVESRAQDLADTARRLVAQVTAAADAASLIVAVDPEAVEVAENVQALLATAEILARQVLAQAGRVSDDIGQRVVHLRTVETVPYIGVPSAK